jgi:hypothetical protein
MRIARIALSLLLGAYMLVDGMHALVTGTYITPGSGAYAGQLGPWASVLSAIGIDPHGLPVKLAFVVLGISWCVHTRNIVVRKVIRPATIVLCVLTLWYLPFGTLIAIEELLCEFVPPLRRATSG